MHYHTRKPRRRGPGSLLVDLAELSLLSFVLFANIDLRNCRVGFYICPQPLRHCSNTGCCCSRGAAAANPQCAAAQIWNCSLIIIPTRTFTNKCVCPLFEVYRHLTTPKATAFRPDPATSIQIYLIAFCIKSKEQNGLSRNYKP